MREVSNYSTPEQTLEGSKQYALVGELAADAWAPMSNEMSKDRAVLSGANEASEASKTELEFSNPYDSAANLEEKRRGKPIKDFEPEGCFSGELSIQQWKKLKEGVLNQIDKMFDDEHELTDAQRKLLFGKLIARRLEEIQCPTKIDG